MGKLAILGDLVRSNPVTYESGFDRIAAMISTTSKPARSSSCLSVEGSEDAQPTGSPTARISPKCFWGSADKSHRSACANSAPGATGGLFASDCLRLNPFDGIDRNRSTPTPQKRVRGCQTGATQYMATPRVLPQCANEGSKSIPTNSQNLSSSQANKHLPLARRLPPEHYNT